jgi:hypothetical protein
MEPDRKVGFFRISTDVLPKPIELYWLHKRRKSTAHQGFRHFEATATKALSKKPLSPHVFKATSLLTKLESGLLRELQHNDQPAHPTKSNEIIMYTKIDLESILNSIPRYPQFVSSSQLSARTGASKVGISKKLKQVPECLIMQKFGNEMHYSRR